LLSEDARRIEKLGHSLNQCWAEKPLFADAVGVVPQRPPSGDDEGWCQAVRERQDCNFGHDQSRTTVRCLAAGYAESDRAEICFVGRKGSQGLSAAGHSELEQRDEASRVADEQDRMIEKQIAEIASETLVAGDVSRQPADLVWCSTFHFPKM
jgi:hypothetical protein